ncbi:sucrose phosphorylase, partial [Pseudoalteromonas sp. S2893]
NGQLTGVFGGGPLLPCYTPIDGSDAGVDPIDNSEVDSRIGTWADIQALGENHDLMADLIVKHVSAQSYQFQNVLAKG